MNKNNVTDLLAVTQKYYASAMAKEMNRSLFGSPKPRRDFRTPLQKFLDRIPLILHDWRMNLASFIAGFDVTESDY